MAAGIASLALGYAAGALSTLSPCVVPLLPILVAGALAQHRLGLWALAAALALSFTAVGLFVATVGISIGIDSEVLRPLAGVLLIAFGAVMAWPVAERAFAAATARRALGVALGAVGIVIVLGVDKPLEAWFVERSPDWLTQLTTRF